MRIGRVVSDWEQGQMVGLVAPVMGDLVMALALRDPVPGWFVLTVAAIFGLLIGSFLNVVIYRMPRRCLSIVKPRSMCPVCKNPIAWYDNIPVLSWVILNGKCRHCATKISMRYPLVELLTGALFLLVVWFDVVKPGAMENPWAWVSAGTHLMFVCMLIAAGFIDADLTIIPDEITYIGTALLLILAAVNPHHGGIKMAADDVPAVREIEMIDPTTQQTQKIYVDGSGKLYTALPTAFSENQLPAEVAHQWPATTLPDSWSPHVRSFFGALFGVLIAAGGMWLLRALATGMLIRKALMYGQGSAMGLGDVKLLALFGAMIGWPGALLSVFFGAAIGLVVTLPMLLTKNKHLFPFGPFLAIAAIVIMLFYGPMMAFIMDVYVPVLVGR